MQKQSSGQKLAINKFSADRKRANTPTTQRAQQTAAVIALADRVLRAASGKPKRERAPGDRFAKLEDFDPGSLGSILRARLARGKS